jgi:hypothetical protein
MVILLVTGGVTLVACGVLTSDRWCDSSGVLYLIVTGGVTVVTDGVTVVVGGVLTSDRWCDSSGMWCTY